ncbi:MAG: cation transporter [Cyanobacteria bacterium]|nr:cation transporter [Cyanobacteria bacterium bin.51]
MAPVHSPHTAHPDPRPPGRRSGAAGAFRWSVLLNSVLSGLQLVIGIRFGSLALIGDAVHNLGDVAGLLLGWGAERLTARPASPRFTYGLGRSTQLAALANGVLILMAAAVLVVEGLQRLLEPVEVVIGPVVWAAAAGIVVNLFSARLFGDDHAHDLNRRAAVVHLLTDAAVSAAVMVSALLVGLTDWSVLDALTAIAVGLTVAWSGWALLRDALRVALDGVPAGIELAAVSQSLLEIPGVRRVHHVHIWGMSTSRNALTAHLVRQTGEIDDTALIRQAQARLADLGIVHSTLQLESWGNPEDP